MQLLHLSTATPLSHSGRGEQEVDERVKKEGSPPCIKLSLGYEHSSHVVEEEERGVCTNAKCVFTAAQLHELQLQAVIFKYIISGLPVPFHLFFTIWNSVSTSLGSADGGIYKLYPTLGRFDYASMTEPEPGRCRRTDGKKWRCKKDVIPGQKYCGQHMHRGRRSRKPVESSEHVMKSSDNTSITSKRTKLYASSDDPGSNFAPASLSSTSRINQNSSIGDSSAKSRPTISCNSSVKHDDYMTCNRKNTTTCQLTPSFITGDAECRIARDRSNNADSNNIDFKRISHSKTNQSQNYEDARHRGGSVPIISISATSDLQHTTETEPHRCRRSDGKKWRCSRNVVPHQRYCETHMHRGAKRTSSYRFCHQTVPENDGSGRNLNTSLSISTLPGPQNMTEDDCNSNSTSDATTITDEIPAFVYH